MQLRDHRCAISLKVAPTKTFSIDESAIVTDHRTFTTPGHRDRRVAATSAKLGVSLKRTVDIVVRGAGGLLLSSALSIACAGRPGSDAPQDTAEMGVPVIPDAGLAVDGGSAESSSAPDPSMSVSPADCANHDQGCPCLHWGETVGCKGPVLVYGTYVTCAGIRECVNGAWGPCWPLAVPAGSPNGVK